MQDWDAIPGAITHNWFERAIGKNQLIKLHNRYMKGREISSKAGVDPAASI